MKKFALFWILIFSFQVYGQPRVSSINGDVTDPYGAVIPNAKVKVIQIVDGKLIEEKSLFAVTNYDGQFSFQNVPTGLYEIQVTVDWTEIIVKKRVKVTNIKSAEADLGFTKYVIEGCSEISETKDLTTEADKAEIINEMLKSVKLEGNSKPILSTKNIKAKWLGKENKELFMLLSQSQIQNRAETKGDFEYYSFPVFKIKGTCMEISLSYFFAQGKKSAKTTLYLSGEGSTYEFRKLNGEWIKSLVSSWVS